ncbi:MAG: hypothetical protein IJZ60_07140 [Bacteroides sp.]|nr:hypothetical protein [Bacteroides sp.]
MQAVLLALEDVITDALKGGEIVRLGDLDTLQIGISSKGTVTEEEYDASLIKKARINFRPGLPTRRWRRNPSRPEAVKRKKKAVRI